VPVGPRLRMSIGGGGVVCYLGERVAQAAVCGWVASWLRRSRASREVRGRVGGPGSVADLVGAVVVGQQRESVGAGAGQGLAADALRSEPG